MDKNFNHPNLQKSKMSTIWSMTKLKSHHPWKTETVKKKNIKNFKLDGRMDFSSFGMGRSNFNQQSNKLNKKKYPPMYYRVCVFIFKFKSH